MSNRMKMYFIQYIQSYDVQAENIDDAYEKLKEHIRKGNVDGVVLKGTQFNDNSWWEDDDETDN